ncbi:VanZ family protein [Streptomyces tanashiensis]|uniref:VanZ family protein n=1 Tax=Streptomyces tanashiensis TaxID=67367 RepID=UPI00343FD6E4
MTAWRAWGKGAGSAGRGKAAAVRAHDGKRGPEAAGTGPGGRGKAVARPAGTGPDAAKSGTGVAKAAKAAPVRQGPGRFVRALVALAAVAGMVAFAVVLARLTLEASPASVPLTHSNLTPGRSIGNYLDQPGFVDTVKQLGGNIALGVPFGILLPLLARKARGFLRVALVTAGTMLLVELVQGALVTGRAFDIDDVFLNTGGALLGYVLVGRRLGRAVHPRTRPRWWRRRRVGDASV